MSTLYTSYLFSITKRRVVEVAQVFFIVYYTFVRCQAQFVLFIHSKSYYLLLLLTIINNNKRVSKTTLNNLYLVMVLTNNNRYMIECRSILLALCQLPIIIHSHSIHCVLTIYYKQRMVPPTTHCFHLLHHFYWIYLYLCLLQLAIDVQVVVIIQYVTILASNFHIFYFFFCF